MEVRVPALIVAFTLIHGAESSIAEERAAVTGKVVDAAGKPLEHATVMVYSAGVKKGLSYFCPTCYPDCGKRTVTDRAGNFAINSLNPELLFTLLVVKEGYASERLWNVDPAKGATAATLKPRPAIEDPSRVARVKVVDGSGKPVRDVLVQPDGPLTYRSPNGDLLATFGDSAWINLLAVSNDQGEFEIAYDRPALDMTLRLDPRGMAPRHFRVPTGEDRTTVTVTDGVLIRGRLMYHGKPVAAAEVGLIPHDRGVGRWYPEVRIGTREDGTFTFTNVPPARIWVVYPKMESLASRGIAAEAIVCETRNDGQEVDLGSIQLKPAHSLRGRVVLSDGKSVPRDMRVTLAAERAFDAQTAPIDADGRFEFRGLPSGFYSLTAGVRGYRLPDGLTLDAFVNRDVNDFLIRMEAIR